MTPIITNADMLTPYGCGIAACWDGLCAGRSAIGHAGEFAREALLSQNAALVPDLVLNERSRVFSMLAPLLDSIAPDVPHDAGILLATTTGEVDLLEKSVLDEASSATKPDPQDLLRVCRERTGVTGPGAVVSAACASSAAAVARAADMIETNETDAVLVIGCDAVSEFVFAGFSTLMALSPECARPFDANRDGLTLGEAAVVALMMHPDRARREGRESIARVCGWGLSSDANHMTGPSRDGVGLADAIERSLAVAGVAASDVQAVCAHGTGTVYNDAMELKAFRTVFSGEPVPVYSVKGGTGHTMGAAGLLEILISAQSLRERGVPPSVGLTQPDADAAGWVATQCREMPASANYVLSTNSGFGGVNSAVVLGAT